MSSILSTTYLTLQAMSVSFTDRNGAAATPAKVYALSDFPASIQTAHLPCRVLFPPSVGSPSVTADILSGAGAKMTWPIADWFILEVAARDTGAMSQFPVLSSYLQSYALKLATTAFSFASGGGRQTMSLALTSQIGLYPYPPQSDSYFWMVKNTIVVEELI